MEMTPRNGSSFSFFFPFFLLFRGNFYRRWSASRVNAFFDFWNGFIIIILERVYRLIESGDSDNFIIKLIYRNK